MKRDEVSVEFACLAIAVDVVFLAWIVWKVVVR